ncbi:YdcF family protein [Burkholderia contaminans]|uniref:YdcF family protein n=1 Tax=Burkholderia contaminans TaxID=488447 RepID=UPI001CF37594|nr:YdcF family protein [Burkholderia contaminans]MCA7917799.1 YdcF family protein [Burkholderia contaminans]UUX41416.1 YdcF family protein [Burkholderia contaminans]
MKNRTKRGFFARTGRVLAIVACLWIVAAVALVAHGLRMPSKPADVAVIFGNALDATGAPKPVLAARLDVGVRCYRTGQCPAFLVSGAIDGPGLNEATAMRDYLVARGVPADRIAVDDQGDNTLATAQHTLAYLQAHRVSRVLIVSQFYHLARARLAFERVGIARANISAAYPARFQLRDIYSSWREVPAYAVYAVRLWVNPDARPVSFRPMLYLIRLFSSRGAGFPVDA